MDFPAAAQRIEYVLCIIPHILSNIFIELSLWVSPNCYRTVNTSVRHPPYIKLALNVTEAINTYKSSKQVWNRKSVSWPLATDEHSANVYVFLKLKWNQKETNLSYFWTAESSKSFRVFSVLAIFSLTVSFKYESAVSVDFFFQPAYNRDVTLLFFLFLPKPQSI